MNENKEFKPYIPADKITPEFTVTSIIMGVILAVIFGAANAYLQPVNHWQPVQFSQCLLCSFGQKKDFVKCRVSWKSH